MSAADRLSIQLSNYEKLAILRAETERKQEELTEVEVGIRERLTRLETQRYLEALDGWYAQHRPANLPTLAEIEEQEAIRASLRQLIAKLEAAIPDALKAAPAGGQPPPPAPAAGARKAKFDSFEDFVGGKG